MAADTIHLFLNPTAGRGRAGRRQTRIIELLHQNGLLAICHESQSPGDIETEVQEQVDAGTARIVVAGGDGSVHEAVNGIMRASGTAALGVIPTGTGNDFAKACELPPDWEHATRLLADRIKSGQTRRQIDIGRCNDRFFANGAGIGFDARVTHIAQSIRWPMGDFVYLLAIFKTMMGGIITPELEIQAGEFTWKGPLTLAAISNGPWVGGMFHIAPMAVNTDNLMNLLIAKPVTRRRILTLLPKLVNGRHLQEPEIIHQPVKALSIRADEAIPSQLDGEVQPLQSDFEISVLPGALNLF